MITPIRTPRELAWRIRIPLQRLRFLVKSAVREYRTERNSKGGKIRRIDIPSDNLKEVQKHIDMQILRNAPLQPILHGGICGHSPHTNAKVHCGRCRVVRIDVRDFFPSITYHQVYRIFVDKLHCSRPVARILTRLTSYRRCIPLGSPASMSLANLVLADADEKIQKKAEGLADIDYTRYVDDLVFSGESSTDLIGDTIDILRNAGFSVSRSKVQIMPRNSPQIVTGYNVNQKRAPSVPPSFRSNTRAAIRELKTLDKGSQAYCQLFENVRGRIEFIKGANPGPARRLERALLDT